MQASCKPHANISPVPWCDCCICRYSHMPNCLGLPFSCTSPMVVAQHKRRLGRCLRQVYDTLQTDRAVATHQPKLLGHCQRHQLTGIHPSISLSGREASWRVFQHLPELYTTACLPSLGKRSVGRPSAYLSPKLLSLPKARWMSANLDVKCRSDLEPDQ